MARRTPRTATPVQPRPAKNAAKPEPDPSPTMDIDLRVEVTQIASAAISQAERLAGLTSTLEKLQTELLTSPQRATFEERFAAMRGELDKLSGELERTHQRFVGVDRIVGAEQRAVALGEQLGTISGTLEQQSQGISQALHAIKSLREANARETLRDLAAEVLAERVEDIRAALVARGDKAHEKLTELLGEIEDEADAYRKLLREVPTGGVPVLQQRIATLEEQLEAASGQRDTQLDEIAQLRRDLSAQHVLIHRLRNEDGARLLDEADRVRRQVQEDLAKLEDIQQLKAHNAQLKEQIEQRRSQDWEVECSATDAAELAAAQRAIAELEHVNRELKRKENQAQAAERRYKADLASSERQLAQARDQLAEHLEDMARQADRQKELDQALADKREALELKRQVDRQLDNLEVQLEQAKVRARDAEEQARQALHEARLDLEAEYKERFDEARDAHHKASEGRVEQAVAHTLERLDQAGEKIAALVAALDASRARELNLTTELELLRQEGPQRRKNLEDELRTHEDAVRAEIDTYRSNNLDALLEQKGELAAEVKALTATSESLTERVGTLEGRRDTFAEEACSLAAQVGELERQLKALEDKEKQLRHLDLPRQERLGDLFQAELQARPTGPAVEDEATWLDEVGRGIEQAGFRVSTRLLHAFHTSLKSAALSPITVLAGISGTGKSELPRLYADLGGLRFLNVAVQPNWDSPDDLFGFFNYTDGRYRATPLARLLNQISGSQRHVSLEDQMVLVLLDEMNIERVEYYFAELLSKLETRRGLERNAPNWERASIEVDAGAGQRGEQLFLDHNLLFAGTMNEDESTLTLSDKVKDRASILTFPSPRRFHSRGKLRPVVERPEALARAAWVSWQRNEDDLDPIRRRELVEVARSFNKAIGHVGQAIGHRVYQAVGTYLANYPRLDGEDEAWRRGLADAWALKLMPKLVGVECRTARGEACLNAVESILPPELVAPFQRAKENDYFTWQGSREIMADDAPGRISRPVEEARLQGVEQPEQPEQA